ncbi:MAG: Hsp70 family protein, partial [Alphaproteobacteria bacterium]|nr:Hsp70 family protein [Alphaproteobacteria bacterium]
AHADEDKKRRDLIQQRNAAQEMINGANKMLSENGDKISEELKNEIKTETENVQKVLESENTEEIKQASDKLMQVMMKAGELIYKATQQAQPSADAAAGAQAEAPKDDNVVDADYEVKDEGK